MKRVKIGVIKCGNIGSAPLFELLLDELADREDIAIRTVTTGPKMIAEAVEDALTRIYDFNPDLLVFISPNPAVQGPRRARKILSEKAIPCIFISDAPGKRLKEEFEKHGFGYIVVMGDPLIGARREFLDPTEMAIFNSNIIKVLAITGVYKIILQEVDRVIHELKQNITPKLPRLVIDVDDIRDKSDFRNPYAKAKAMAAYELTKKVAEINTKACFIEREREKYVPLVACAHEIAQVAAKLAEEAREIEKYSDTLVRRPHSKDGKPKIKEKLMEKPVFDEETYQSWFE
ncbi:F420-dependent methylenetetrahydromethanopterin dehydrogenase [Candidatus Bathyarchaeota archaeon]|nr:MAG: F420-dependent methylenetetrahydromethanopterin dehydrogenase [Candidatus Bathyarchaeota archaeon]